MTDNNISKNKKIGFRKLNTIHSIVVEKDKKNHERRNFSFTTIQMKKDDNVKILSYIKNKESIIREEEEEETHRLFLQNKLLKTRNRNNLNEELSNDKINNSTIQSSMNNESYSLLKAEDKIHVFFKEPPQKLIIKKNIFNKKVPICLKQKSIENVIERNKMIGNLNKKFEEIKKKVIAKKKKTLIRNSSHNLNQYLNIKRFSQIYDSKNLLFPHRKNNSTLKLKEPSINNKNIPDNNPENFFKTKRFTQDQSFIPDKKIDNYYFKIKASQIAKEKTKKTLKAIRSIIPSNYENLSQNTNYSIKNLSRVKELIHLKRNNYDETIKNKKFRINTNLNYNYFRTINHFSTPSFFKNAFKKKTIQIFKNYKGFGFGVTRNGKEIFEKYDRMKYKTVD